MRSDVYALGLVLYEIFTGRVAFPAKTLAEAAERGETTPSRPSSYVENLDPAIERAIERCLETDPALRPATATDVAASLPGDDPLAAALAAGETPSPELVAAAGGTGGFRPAVALAALAAIGVGIAVSAWVAERSMPYLAELDKPPEVLAHEAREVLLEHGAAEEPADSAYGFVVERYEEGSAHLLFWYRQSPRSLIGDLTLQGGNLSFRHPPSAVPGMAGVRMDADGRLLEYVRVPGTGSDPADGAGPGWQSLLSRAGLDPTHLQSVEPQTIPPVFADARAAWRAADELPPVRIEAASLQGWPVWLLVRSDRGGEATAPSAPSAAIYVTLAILLMAGIVARRNLRLERGDRAGAFRVGAFGGFVSIVGFGLLGSVRSVEPTAVFLGFCVTLFFSLAFWLTYLALEPIVRRRWPDTLASWTRLLAGRFLDPLLGRDLLLGVLAGVGLALFELTGRLITGIDSGQWMIPPDLLLGGWVALLLLAVLRQLLRSTWAAVLVTLGLTGVMFGDLSTPTGVALTLPFMAIVLGVVIRLGLLSAATALTVHHLLAHTFMTTHLTAWYADSAVAGILATLALAAWGFYAAIGARSSGARRAGPS